MDSPDSIACALFLTSAFLIAGFLQSFWFRSPWSHRFQIPLDGKRTFRGKRLFGDNKTWRGFIAMVPGVGAAFIVLRLLFEPTSYGLWPMSVLQYGLVGCWVGFGFMLGELPNSFAKRQLGIPSGEAPQSAAARQMCFLADRLDSIVGGLIALSLAAPVPLLTWALILLVGPAFHWTFSLFLFHLGVKARPA